MNAYARNTNFSQLALVDDAAPAAAAPRVETDVARSHAEPEPNLAELPTLPRIPGRAPAAPVIEAANASTVIPAIEPKPMDLAPAERAAAPSRVAEPGTAPMDTPTRSPAVGTDRCLAEATREFAAGKVDQPLWMRAMTQANGDEALARAAYLKARATAIRITRRELRHEFKERHARAIGTLHGDSHAGVAGRGLAGLASRRNLVALAGGAGALVVALVATWLVMREPAGTAPSGVAAQDAVANVRPGKPAPAAAAAGGPPATAAAPSAAEVAAKQAQDLRQKVADLAAAGNWNVLVLHASEWTRKAPDNADAWLALGEGFTRLRQHGEAVEALNRATALAPARADAWRLLGEAHAARGTKDDALAAFERAVALDGKDIASIVRIGAIRADQGDLAKAKGAYDQALAQNPADVEALCGLAAVAQKSGRAKDAQAFARQVVTLGSQCPEAAPEPAAAPVRIVGGKPPAAPAAARR